MSATKTERIEGPYRTVFARHGRMTLFANDTGAVSRSLIEYGEWAENELAFLCKLVPPGATIVDVGAYIGTHTLAFSHFVGPRGGVVAIEPQDQSFELLTKNVEDNRLANVTLRHAAAAAEAGTMEMRPIDPERQASFGSASLFARKGDTANIILDSGQSPNTTMTIGMMTIDSLELASCALIKIDAEGFEELVVRGAQETVRRLAPAIYAECNSVENGLKTARALWELGYGVRMHVVDVFNPDNFLHNGTDAFSGAREAALVGLCGKSLELIDSARPRQCELVLKIEAADDVVLGMLNKPQYPLEILRVGAAAHSGGAAWLDGLKELRIGYERSANEAAWAKGELETERARASAAEVERARIANELALATGELDQARRDAAASQARAEASMQQARFARQAADQAEIAAAELERRMAKISSG
jgi:FkbM family methyltransferase